MLLTANPIKRLSIGKKNSNSRSQRPWPQNLHIPLLNFTCGNLILLLSQLCLIVFISPVLGVILPVFGAVYLWEAASRSQGQELLSTAAVDVTVSHGAALTHHHMSARNKIPGTYTTHINAIAPHKRVSFILFKHLWWKPSIWTLFNLRSLKQNCTDYI